MLQGWKKWWSSLLKEGRELIECFESSIPFFMSSYLDTIAVHVGEYEASQASPSPRSQRERAEIINQSTWIPSQAIKLSIKFDLSLDKRRQVEIQWYRCSFITRKGLVLGNWPPRFTYDPVRQIAQLQLAHLCPLLCSLIAFRHRSYISSSPCTSALWAQIT